MSNSTIVSQLKVVSNLLEEAQKIIQSLEKNLESNIPQSEVQTLKSYLDYEDQIDRDLENRNENTLLNYTHFNCNIFQDFINMHMIDAFKNEKVMIHIIDHMDLENVVYDNWKPIHYVCRFCTLEIIRHLVEKGVNLEVETLTKWKPIHLVCRFSTLETIRYIVEKGVELEVESDRQWRPIHYVCKRGDMDILRFFYEKKVNTECKTIEGFTPMSLLLENSS